MLEALIGIGVAAAIKAIQGGLKPDQVAKAAREVLKKTGKL